MSEYLHLFFFFIKVFFLEKFLNRYYSSEVFKVQAQISFSLLRLFSVSFRSFDLQFQICFRRRKIRGNFRRIKHGTFRCHLNIFSHRFLFNHCFTRTIQTLPSKSLELEIRISPFRIVPRNFPGTLNDNPTTSFPVNFHVRNVSATQTCAYLKKKEKNKGI